MVSKAGQWGGSGTIFASNNGGETWTAQNNDVKADLWSVYFAADGQHGWAVGSHGTILSSSNAGETWVEQRSDVKVNLWSVHFAADGQRGWVVGDDGTILVSSNGGQSWVVQNSGVTDALMSVHFTVDGQRGWAVGHGGTILSSLDAGKTWAAQSSGISAYLWSVYFSVDGRHGWAVGDGGAILVSSNGGQTWTQQNSGVDSSLLAIRFNADGQHGWAAGAGGIILSTSDGGSNWSVSDSKVGAERLALAFDQTGTVGWAVGYPPALLKSEDGGKNWTPQPYPLQYRQYLAPWFWLMLIVIGRLVFLALRSYKSFAGAAALGVTDRPSGDFAKDRLQFAPLARGISRFLRNVKTEPPMTIAISGDWGSGKSTLMELVSSDLKKYGCQPISFNAWHHQNEGQLFAALLTSIRDTGLPSIKITTPEYWVFKIKLIWIRINKHPKAVFFVLFIISFCVGLLFQHDLQEYSTLWHRLVESQATDQATRPIQRIGENNIFAIKLLAAILSFIASLIGVLHKIKAFNANPAILHATNSSGHFKLRDATAQASFLTRFAEQFDEVTQALPYRMVVVIDDLDRCHPETVLEVMEAVNYLMSSGRFFVIFGMAPHRVQAALALSFEEIAKELVELDEQHLPKLNKKYKRGATPMYVQLSPKPSEEQLERDRRRAYARDYMEKLINLEIKVPNSKDIAPHKLLERTEKNGVSWIKMLLPLCLLCAAVWLGFTNGNELFVNRVGHSQLLQENAKADSDKPEITELSNNVLGNPNQEKTRFKPHYVPAMRPGDDQSISWYCWVAVFIFVVIAVDYIVYRLRKNLCEVKDSEKFHQALRIWLPVVQQQKNTPRSIKRFINRIRYLAMLQHSEILDKTVLDEFIQSVKMRFSRYRLGRTAAPLSDVSAKAIGEYCLVALGALHEVYGADWRNRLKPLGDDELSVIVSKARADYAEQLVAVWPPSEEELEVFERLLQGVRLAGDA